MHKTESHKSVFSRRILELPLRETERTDVYSNHHHADKKQKKKENIQSAFYGNVKNVDIFFFWVSEIHCAKYTSTLSVNGSVTPWMVINIPESENNVSTGLGHINTNQLIITGAA